MSAYRSDTQAAKHPGHYLDGRLSAGGGSQCGPQTINQNRWDFFSQAAANRDEQSFFECENVAARGAVTEMRPDHGHCFGVEFSI